MAVIQGFFDASSDRLPGLTAVAGMVGPEDVWRPIEERWRERLKYWEIPRFHFFDVLNEKGQEDGELCVRQFCKAVGPNSGLHLRTSVMDNRDWSASSDRDANYDRIFPQPQHACLFNLFTELSLLRREFPGDEIKLVFDSDYGTTSRALAVYEAWKEYYGDEGFSVTIDRRLIGLEIADLAANLARLEGLPTKDGWLGLGGKWGQHWMDLSGGSSAGVMWSNWISQNAKEAIARHLAKS